MSISGSEIDPEQSEGIRLSYSLEASDDELTLDTEEDEELRLAKQMALAIAANPNLTPAEVKKIAEEQSTKKKEKKPVLRRISKSAKKAAKLSIGKKASSSEKRSAPKLGEFLEASKGASIRDYSLSGDDADTFHGNATQATFNTVSQQMRICGIVWKRRSGLGKYSTSAAWERRRIVLKGSKLMYYRTNGDTKDEEASTASGGGESDGEGKSKSWLEHYGGVVQSSMVGASSKKSARGYLDLVKENANVCASTGHSGAPTPFALSIKIMTQTKWKLCFDTHAELMQWLSAMTDVIVQGSVDAYNTDILQANDPAAGADGHYSGQLSEPPLIAHAGMKGAGGHRLWVTGHYSVKSENYPEAGLEDISEHEFSDSEDNVGLSHRGDSLVLEMDPDSGKDVWTIPCDQLWQIGLLMNLAICIARASSTSVERFWYLLTFTNILLFGFLTHDKVGATVKPNVMSSKMARRLSATTVQVKVEESSSRTKSDSAHAIPEPSKGFKPRAGTTAMQIANPTDLPVNKDGHVFAGWRVANPETMAVRSHGYLSTKKKTPSPGELYKCAHVDVFEGRTRFPDMASRVVLPEVEFKEEGPKTWNSPDIFVVSIAIPTDPPKLYSSSENGGGYTVTMYFTMHHDTRDILKRVTADGYDPASETCDDIQKSKVNAVRLLEEWCRRAPTDDAFAARFKVLPNAQNLKEIGLPSWISKYNGKPFLIKRPGQTGFIYRHPDKSCFEFDISLHPFPYLAKQGICFMKDTYFKKVLVTFGFLIEGRSDDELPECLIGLTQLCYPDPVHAIQGEDFLAGKAAKSF